MSIDTIVDERTLREIYLTAFEMAIKEGDTKTVMSAYNMLNGTYTNENQHLMQEILREDRKSTRLNSSHVAISYAVFCLKKKKDNIYFLMFKKIYKKS